MCVRSWRGVLDTTLCDKSVSVTCGRLLVFSGYSSINKTDRHDMAESNMFESDVIQYNSKPPLECVMISKLSGTAASRARTSTETISEIW